MKFETALIHFLSDVFGLLSSENFATMAMWRNDFSCLFKVVCLVAFDKKVFFVRVS